MEDLREDHSFAALGDNVWQFALENNAAGIRALCGRGVTARKANLAGQTPLHIGASCGNAEAVQALLDCQADPNKKNLMRGGGPEALLCCPPEVQNHFRHLMKLTERGTPLQSAANGRGPPEKRAECIKFLLARGANPCEKDIKGDLPVDCADNEIVMLALGAAPLVLHHAVKAKSRTALSDALTQVCAEANLIRPDRAASTLDDKNLDGETALHLAAALGWHEGVESLLASRASVLAENRQQTSPLHVAVLSGCLHSVSLLIRARANVNAQDRDMNFAGYKSKSFEECPHAHRSPLHYAAELDNVLIVRQLLDAKAEPNCKDMKLMTPLHLCIAAREEDNLVQSSDEMVDLLIAARADVNLGNQVMGLTHTCLHEAALLGDTALLLKIVSAKAELNHTAKLGMTALHLAARSKHHDVIHILVEAHADLRMATSGGKTAAELAKTNGASPAMLDLLRGGLQVPTS